MGTDTTSNTEKVENNVEETPQAIPPPLDDLKPEAVEPDLKFIQAIESRTGEFYKKCIQCGTCSATCDISPDVAPFPRKELAWATWGMKDRLMKDPDIWLCYQCNDCTMRCPRGARPGEVLALIRQECVKHYSVPKFLGKWVNDPAFAPLLLAIPVLLLALALYVKEPIEAAMPFLQQSNERILFSYSSMFPHWLLISFFLFFSALALIMVLAGANRYWRAMKQGAPQNDDFTPVKGVIASMITALGRVIRHDNFGSCTKSISRNWTHQFVFFGFIALSFVALWIITAQINPLIRGEFIYPFSFWSPWKVLANLGGVAILAGVFYMMVHRIRDNEKTGPGSYFDWAFLCVFMLVVLSGFATEVLHYVRLEPHRHLIYFAHLVCICALLMYLPYTKFAHLFYRYTALVYSERIGREAAKSTGTVVDKKNTTDVVAETKEPEVATSGAH